MSDEVGLLILDCVQRLLSNPRGFQISVGGRGQKRLMNRLSNALLVMLNYSSPAQHLRAFPSLFRKDFRIRHSETSDKDELYIPSVGKNLVDLPTDIIRRKATPGQMSIYVLDGYASEIKNGGHEQYFFNSTGDTWPDVIESLKMIRAPKEYVNLFTTVLAKFPKGFPSQDRAQRIKQLNGIRLQEADAEFDALDEKYPFENLMREYIAANPEQFFKE